MKILKSYSIMGCSISKAKISCELSSDDYSDEKSEKKQILEDLVTNNQQDEGIRLPFNGFCFGIGDIEGNYDKAKKVVDFIQLNPTKRYVFLGDLFDDISWKAKNRSNQLNCFKLLADAGLLDSAPEMESINDFHNIKFESTDFESSKTKVHFIAGNAETEALYDIISDLDNNKEKNEEGYYCFGSGKFEKRFTYEELSILYKYLSLCRGSILYKINEEKTMVFRHAAKFFKTNFKDIDQKSDIVASKNTPIICGHNKEFGNCEHNIYMTDTSESKYPDYRIMVIQINRGELNMSAMSIDFTYPVLPCFPRPPKKK